MKRTNEILSLSLFPLATLAILLANLSPLYADEIDAEVNAALAKNWDAKHWESIDANLKEKIVIRLRELMDDKRDVSENFRWREPARIALLIFGDERAMDDTFQKYGMGGRRRIKMANMMKKTPQLLLVPRLATDLASDEPATSLKVEGEVFIGPKSVTSSDVICSVIANSKKISPEVRNWVRRWSTEKPAELLSQVRLFWARNAGAFAKKDYAAVAVPE